MRRLFHLIYYRKRITNLNLNVECEIFDVNLSGVVVLTRIAQLRKAENPNKNKEIKAGFSIKLKKPAACKNKIINSN
jgi:hypothetical protein